MVIPYPPGKKQFLNSLLTLLKIGLQKNPIISPDKFQAIILDRKKSNLTDIPLTIDNKIINSVSSAELIGIHSMRS